MNVRRPIFAEQGWYPPDEETCRQEVQRALSTQAPIESAVGGIVPHAGWFYSASVAGRTFGALSKAKPEVVLLFGGHLHVGERPVCMPEGAFGTPLGSIPVHEELAQRLFGAFDVDEELPTRFAPDNTIELQLPFIRHLWPQSSVLAVQVPPSTLALSLARFLAEEVQRLGLPCVVLGSSDLTHYGPNYGFLPKGVGEAAQAWSKAENDGPFLDHLEHMETTQAIEHALVHHSACCSGAAAAACASAQVLGAQTGQLLAHTTSYEVEPRGTPTTWVGYGSMVFR